MTLTNLFRKLGRYFVPHAGLLPELLDLTETMDFSMKISEKSVKYFSVLPLDDEGDCISSRLNLWMMSLN